MVGNSFDNRVVCGREMVESDPEPVSGCGVDLACNDSNRDEGSGTAPFGTGDLHESREALVYERVDDGEPGEAVDVDHACASQGVSDLRGSRINVGAVTARGDAFVDVERQSTSPNQDTTGSIASNDSATVHSWEVVLPSRERGGCPVPLVTDTVNPRLDDVCTRIRSLERESRELCRKSRPAGGSDVESSPLMHDDLPSIGTLSSSITAEDVPDKNDEGVAASRRGTGDERTEVQMEAACASTTAMTECDPLEACPLENGSTSLGEDGAGSPKRGVCSDDEGALGGHESFEDTLRFQRTHFLLVLV